MQLDIDLNEEATEPTTEPVVDKVDAESTNSKETYAPSDELKTASSSSDGEDANHFINEFFLFLIEEGKIDDSSLKSNDIFYFENDDLIHDKLVGTTHSTIHGNSLNELIDIAHDTVYEYKKL